MRGNCGECERRYFCEIDPDKCNEWPDPAPKTNADRIRAMSDEELCVLMLRGVCEEIGADQAYCETRTCVDCTLEWLKQPADGE